MKHPETDSQSSQISQIAADWLARRVRGFTPDEQSELESWLNKDSRHVSAFVSLEQTWKSLDQLKELGPQTIRRFEADLPPLASPIGRPRPSMLVFKAAFAVAAAFALVFLGWRQFSNPSAPFTRNVVTRVGEQKRVDLIDGSSISFNTDTAVDIAYSLSERRVRLLRGEARFAVAKDRDRPFVVEVGGVVVRAVGTAFNVFWRPEAVEVIVTEGKVRVADTKSGVSLLAPSAAAGEPLLHEGERVVIAVTSGLAMPANATPVSAAEIERALAWQDRRVVFDDTPLSEVVAEFNRYNRHKLVIGDPRLSDRRFGGTFAVGNQAVFVRLLESRFGVRAERGADETVLRLAEEDKSP